MHPSDVEKQIEREVQRRVGIQSRRFNDEIAELHGVIKEIKSELIKQDSVLERIQSEPLSFGSIIKLHNIPNKDCFKPEDEVVVVDPDSEYFRQTGHVLNRVPIVDDGCCAIRLSNGIVDNFSIGLDGRPQIRLAKKDDGTFAVIFVDGKPWEVRGIPDLGLKVGEPVKIKPDTKAIISRGYDFNAGPICKIVAVSETSVEVSSKGAVHSVFNPHAIDLEEGDRVVCDYGMFYIMQKLPKDNRSRYKIKPQTVTWDEVGGLDNAKQELRDALELPFQHPDLFSHYNVNPLRGVLLYGPPGCGKTLLARVAANAVANIHGKEATDTGYIFVKGPEILNMFVGNTEGEIRELFERGRRHFRQHGYKGILAIDEADAILPQRGTRRSSDIADTIVPMFLGEMDGVDEQHTRENPIVILMTNRADVLDPAITRAGRISKHIKIDRPNDMNAIDILDIHTKNMPFDGNRMGILAVTVADVYSKSRTIYRVNNEFSFTLGDACNGAMLANLAESAKMLAVHRDLANQTKTGVKIEDFREAVNKLFNQQGGMNHSYDLHDFAEKHGLQPQNIQITRCFGAT